jgi:beta-glucanase (GH16 family)
MKAPGWRLVFDDKFARKGAFDTSKWSFCPRENPAWARYLTPDKDYAYLDGENLVLKMDNRKITGDDVPYRSGGIDTRGKFAFTYGKVDVRAKFRQGQGAWPAIWMMPVNAVYGDWPNSGEIDIMGHVNYLDNISQTVHNAAVTSVSDGASSATKTAQYHVNDYNVYGLVWTPDSIKFYVNHQLQYVYGKPRNATARTWPYDQPYYLILNQSGGAGWPGAVNDKDLPFEMKVDWVRVYKTRQTDSLPGDATGSPASGRNRLRPGSKDMRNASR